MGLDQWIFKKKIDDEISSDDESVIYWRKCNQVHEYMNKLFDGVENTHNYPISLEQLIELKERCEKILENHSLADELLPTTSGFFYGSTEYDEIYFMDLEYSVEKINHLLDVHEDGYDYYYHSWW